MELNENVVFTQGILLLEFNVLSKDNECIFRQLLIWKTFNYI